MGKYGYILVMLGAAMWGSIGIFIHKLYQLGFSPMQVIAVRVITAGLILLIYMAFKERKLLRIRFADMYYFVGTGICSIVFFNWCYFTAMKETSLSIAVVLLYTAPAFVMLISCVLLIERLTVQKMLSLILALLGCTLVAGYLPGVQGVISFTGFIAGIGSGFGYALYSIFSKSALNKYHPLTVITYTFIFASLVMIPVILFGETKFMIWNGSTFMTIAGLGLIPTVLAYFLYTKGLTYIESSKASIIATFELLVATTIGVFLFNDVLTYWQLIGIVFIFISVIIIQSQKNIQKRLKLTKVRGI